MDKEKWIPREIREKIRILVVEDNVLNQKLDRYILTGWGLRHDVCDNGRKAVDRLKIARFDLVLMDVRMPELNGYEATWIIRYDLGLDVPIIGITAHANEEEKRRCLEAGMNSYLSKPVDEEMLYSLVCGFLIPEEVGNAEEEEE